MTATTDFDRLVAAWLQEAGSTEMRDGAADVALRKARGISQRRGVRAWLLGPGIWPVNGRWRGLPALSPATRIMILVALTLAVVAGAAVVGSQLLRRASVLPTPPADIDDATSTEAWTTTGSPVIARSGHTATLLRDGRVLLVGGSGSTSMLASAEIWDPSSGRFSSTGALATPRAWHTATLLPDGRVLVAGGETSTGASGGLTALRSAELYDPATGSFSEVGPMTTSRGTTHVVAAHPSATLLADGRVLIVGGWPAVNAEIFDPATRTFHSIPGIPCPGDYTLEQGVRSGHSDPRTVTRLLDGRVLITCLPADLLGGVIDPPPTSAALFDPITETYLQTGAPTTMAWQSTALLSDGRVMLVGSGDQPVRAGRSAVELYDPATGRFERTTIDVARIHQVVPLADGGVLVVASTGIYSLDLPSGTVAPVVLATHGAGYTCTLLSDGAVLCTGQTDVTVSTGRSVVIHPFALK